MVIADKGFRIGITIQSRLYFTQVNCNFCAMQNVMNEEGKYEREEAKPQETQKVDYVTREEFERRIAEIMKSGKEEKDE